MIRLLLVLFTLVGFLIFSYPFLVAQVSLGKKDPHARDLETIKVVRSVFKVLLKLAGVTVTVKGHEPERSKIQPDHAVDIQHPPCVIPWTYPKAFQECSREVFCEKDQDHVQDPMSEDPVLYRDLSPVSDPAVHPFPDGPQKDSHSIYREHVY